MKKIKKIFPLLLGIMVLMFGTLTVSAKSVYADADIKEMNSMIAYSKKVNLPQYANIIYIRTSETSSEIFVSDKPLTFYFTPMGYPSLYVNEETNYYKVSYAKETVTGATDLQTGSKKGAGRDINSAQTRYYYANYDIYCIYTNGTQKYADAETDFFPRPPVAQVAVGLPEVVRKQTKVILITAVACLALLVISSVLPKKLPRFLNR